jgi:hypothetical protein
MRVSGRTQFVVVIAAGLLGTWAWISMRRPPLDDRGDPDHSKPVAAREIPLTEPATSRFLNTAADVEFVGSDACRECHQEEWESYSRSGMARSTREIDVDREPPDEILRHEASGRRFQSLRHDGTLRHREELINGDRPLLLAEHKMRYVIGSGTHFTMYLNEIDGFLVESPLTWYASKPGWDMSPGYDQPQHLGFQREITVDCLFCHAGQAEAIDGSYHRIRIDEMGIGCERCHGPGALHVARQTSGPDTESEFDPTIVNPARLSRERADAVCHQCHLQPQAYVAARGRSLADYRPGLKLEDFQHYYRSADPQLKMKVVGHTEQMLLSRCYRESETMTCMTCHNPHATAAPAKRATSHRRACLECHDTDRCSSPANQRRQTKPPDDCVACHMPTVSTNTLHVAVTHHRIGIHRKDSQTTDSDNRPPSPDLEPIHDLSRFHPLDRQRSLGLAYLKSTFRMDGGGGNSGLLWNRSRELLLKSRSQGLRDPEVDATLAQLLFFNKPTEAVDYARTALKAPELSIESRLNALFALASHHQQQQRPREALRHLDELTKLRRSAADWELRALCLLQQRDTSQALRALETAVAIDPELLPARKLLIQLYREQGNRDKLANQEELVERLTRLLRARGQGNDRRRD